MSKVEINYTDLKLKIISKFGNFQKFAQAIGKSNSYVSKVMHSKSFLEPSEIIEWCDMLDIDWNEIPRFFFKLVNQE